MTDPREVSPSKAPGRTTARKAIKDWPENERPREKLVRFGAEALSDGELLAILLRNLSRRNLPLLGRYGFDAWVQGVVGPQ